MKRGSESAVDRYVELPYHINLVQDGEQDGGKWIASAEELPDCSSRGDTAEEAIAGLKDAMATWIAAALREGRDIPEPRSATSHSGRLLLRMPRTLHAALTKAAERENVSLNQFITDSLASVVGWRLGTAAGEGDGTPAPINQEPGAAGLTAQAARLSVATFCSPRGAGASAIPDGRPHGELPARGDRRHDRDPRAPGRPLAGAGIHAAPRRGPTRRRGPASAFSTSRSPRRGTSSARHVNGLTRR